MKKFKLTHIFMILATAYTISPVAKATYQDSIILQYLIVAFTYINEALESAGLGLTYLKEYTSGMSVQNAIKQKTDVLGMVIADQTTTLGNEELKNQFGIIDTIEKNGKSYKVGSVASSGCFNKNNAEHHKNVYEVKKEFNEDWVEIRNDLISPETTLADVRGEITEAYAALINEREHIGNPFSPPADLSESDAKNLSKVAYFLINNNESFVSQVGGNRSGLAKRNDKKAKYDFISTTVGSVVNDNISDSIQTDFNNNIKLSKREKLLADSALANSEARITANNLKTPKGMAMESLEYKYKEISINLEKLRSRRNQEKLLTVIVLDRLEDFHKRLIGAGSG